MAWDVRALIALLDEDLAHGQAAALLVLALWPGSEEAAGRPDPVKIWSARADEVSGAATICKHLQPEDRPDEVVETLVAFFLGHGAGKHDP